MQLSSLVSSTLELQLLPLVLRNLITTTSKSKYMYITKQLYNSVFLRLIGIKSLIGILGINVVDLFMISIEIIAMFLSQNSKNFLN